MPDLGDLLGLGLFPAASRKAGRKRIRCRNPACGRWVYADRAIGGCGQTCAEHLGLAVHRWRLAARPQQPGPTLLDILEAPMDHHPRRFLLAEGDRTFAEGAVFSDGAAVVYRPPAPNYRHPTGSGPAGNRLFSLFGRFPAGTVVAGRLARGEVPRAIVPEMCDAPLTLRWLDPLLTFPLLDVDPSASSAAALAGPQPGMVPPAHPRTHVEKSIGAEAVDEAVARRDWEHDQVVFWAAVCLSRGARDNDVRDALYSLAGDPAASHLGLEDLPAVAYGLAVGRGHHQTPAEDAGPPQDAT